jgi:hypothetical protein
MLRGRFGPVIVLVAVAAIAGLGICLLDGDHIARGDLCLLSLATTSNFLLAIPLALTGRFTPGFAQAHPRYSPDLPAPPPKD